MTEMTIVVRVVMQMRPEGRSVLIERVQRHFSAIISAEHEVDAERVTV